jgi:hypothetical protein
VIGLSYSRVLVPKDVVTVSTTRPQGLLVGRSQVNLLVLIHKGGQLQFLQVTTTLPIGIQQNGLANCKSRVCEVQALFDLLEKTLP